jgi:hypothetical protein
LLECYAEVQLIFAILGKDNASNEQKQTLAAVI